MTATVYGVLVLVTLAGSALLDLDRDTGPGAGESYPWLDRWTFWHVFGSYALGFASYALGVPIVAAWLITVAAGVGWELVNGHVSGSDIIFDALGATAGVALAFLALH